jgi:hypothetical protein
MKLSYPNSLEGRAPARPVGRPRDRLGVLSLSNGEPNPPTVDRRPALIERRYS